ncbi:uroporphyrinogen-III synthase [Candidatus Methanoperedens nitroreducens]|uniref:Uroporphyrinogen-III synthase n=1 Tax=Candidatus Methanoperedens nitratireducens TaxID=1392998 RepID=A0A062V7M5_9EURY|nr:uroporphyrinogen-III synthase [Candidatus Methanoperedens nitroreducens]KCZ72558.1 uroporphyrinogen-III synthase [Candidatus Methanoperedens nitroreducens]MDJ1423509.1 uroporphyrinogen-III synthase [Candidatus Methanoperedens sp.]
MKVMAIMRPAAYLAESVKLAGSMGFKTITAPMIDVVDKTDANFKGFVERIMGGVSDYVIFTSANGVEFTLLKLDEPDEFIEYLNRTKVVAIGPKTKEALIKNGIVVSIVPESYSSEGLVEHLGGIEGAVIEIARSSHGAPELVRGLLEKGAEVHETQVYEIIRPSDERHKRLVELALAGDIDIFAFTSSMMARNLMALADETGVREELIRMMNEKIVAAIGKPTSDTLSGFGVKVKIMPERYTFEELLLECRKQDC